MMVCVNIPKSNENTNDILLLAKERFQGTCVISNPNEAQFDIINQTLSSNVNSTFAVIVLLDITSVTSSKYTLLSTVANWEVIKLPSLRQLVNHLVDLARFFYGKIVHNDAQNIFVSDEAKQQLENNSWIGNFDAFISAMQESAKEKVNNNTVLQKLSFIADIDSIKPKKLKIAMQDYKRDCVYDVLRMTGGNQTKASAILGIQRSYLNKLLHDWKVNA